MKIKLVLLFLAVGIAMVGCETNGNIAFNPTLVEADGYYDDVYRYTVGGTVSYIDPDDYYYIVEGRHHHHLHGVDVIVERAPSGVIVLPTPLPPRPIRVAPAPHGGRQIPGRLRRPFEGGPNHGPQHGLQSDGQMRPAPGSEGQQRTLPPPPLPRRQSRGDSAFQRQTPHQHVSPAPNVGRKIAPQVGRAPVRQQRAVPHYSAPRTAPVQRHAVPRQAPMPRQQQRHNK